MLSFDMQVYMEVRLVVRLAQTFGLDDVDLHSGRQLLAPIVSPMYFLQSSIALSCLQSLAWREQVSRFCNRKRFTREQKRVDSESIRLDG